MSSSKHYNTMTDAPVLTKLGIVSTHSEMTPFVCVRDGEERLMRVDTVSVSSEPYIRAGVIVDCESGWESPVFGAGYEFFSGYYENGTLYAFCTSITPDGTSNSVYVLWSEDFVNWQKKEIIHIDGRRFYNTSVCRGANGYVIAVETATNDPVSRWTPPYDPVLGHPFTEFFGVSDDLMNWRMLGDDYAYSKERYVACPALRYSEDDGYYYMICLEELPLVHYEPYIYRSRDLKTWEGGVHNPVLWVTPEDRIAKEGIVFDEETEKCLRTYRNINNCDVDLCEFRGKTHVFFLTGDQCTIGFMGEAVYDGGMYEFLRRHFE